MKKIKLLILLIRFISGIFIYKQIDSRSAVTKKNEGSIENPKISIDMLGTGVAQKAYISYSDNEILIQVKDGDELVAKEELEKGKFKEPIVLSGVKLSTSDPKEYLHWVQTAGPHQFESFFFTVDNGKVVNLLGADLESELWYAPFWTSRGSDILIKDIDEDGFKEVVEFVDEYPPEAPRLIDDEIKQITKNEFDDDVEDDMWEIISRENSGEGRGFRAVWNIYSFVDAEKPYFRKLNNEELEDMTRILLKASPAYLGDSTFSMNTEEGLFTPDPETDLSDTISRSQLTDNSIEFNEFVRDFWAGGYYLEPFGEYKPIKK